MLFAGICTPSRPGPPQLVMIRSSSAFRRMFCTPDGICWRPSSSTGIVNDPWVPSLSSAVSFSRISTQPPPGNSTFTGNVLSVSYLIRRYIILDRDGPRAKPTRAAHVGRVGDSLELVLVADQHRVAFRRALDELRRGGGDGHGQ